MTDVSARLPDTGRAASLRLREVDRVFPLFTIPAWVAGRLFYQLVTLTLRWLALPLLVALAVYETVAYLVGDGVRLVGDVFTEIAYEAALVLVFLALFIAVARHRANRAIRAAGGIPVDPTAATIRPLLEAGEPSPQEGDLRGEVTVFVSGHTHAPALSELDGPAGRIAFVNSGCWLRQVQPVAAHLRLPAVYASHFIQTHVRVRRTPGGTEVELWEHPRPAQQRPPAVERLAIAGTAAESSPTPASRGCARGARSASARSPHGIEGRERRVAPPLPLRRLSPAPAARRAARGSRSGRAPCPRRASRRAPRWCGRATRP